MTCNVLFFSFTVFFLFTVCRAGLWHHLKAFFNSRCRLVSVKAWLELLDLLVVWTVLCVCLMVDVARVDAGAVDCSPVFHSTNAPGQYPSAVPCVLRVLGRDSDIHGQVTGMTLSNSRVLFSPCKLANYAI